MSYFEAKMHQIRFRLWLRPRPRWGSLLRSPEPLTEYKGSTSKGRDEREGQGRKRRDGMGPTSKARGRGRRGKKEEEKRVNGRDRVKWEGRVSPQPKNQTSLITVKRRSACTE